MQLFDAYIDGDAKEESEEYNYTETMWGVFKAYAFFFLVKLHLAAHVLQNTMMGSGIEVALWTFMILDNTVLHLKVMMMM